MHRPRLDIARTSLFSPNFSCAHSQEGQPTVYSSDSMSKIHNLTRLSVRLELELSWFSEEYGPKIYFKYIYVCVSNYPISNLCNYLRVFVIVGYMKLMQKVPITTTYGQGDYLICRLFDGWRHGQRHHVSSCPCYEPGGQTMIPPTCAVLHLPLSTWRGSRILSPLRWLKLTRTHPIAKNNNNNKCAFHRPRVGTSWELVVTTPTETSHRSPIILARDTINERRVETPSARLLCKVYSTVRSVSKTPQLLTKTFSQQSCLCCYTLTPLNSYRGLQT